MVEVLVLGVGLSEDDINAVVLLYPLRTKSILRLSLAPSELFAVSSALHSSSPLSRLTQGKEENKDSSGEQAKTESKLGSSETLPTIHNIFTIALQKMRAKVLSAEISPDYAGSVLAKIIIASPAGRIRLNAKIGDAIAMALNSGTRIFLSKSLLAQAEDLEVLLASLPEHIRTIARASLPTDWDKESEEKTQEPKGTPGIRISLVMDSSSKKLRPANEVKIRPSTLNPEQLDNADDKSEEDELKELLKNMTPETKVPM